MVGTRLALTFDIHLLPFHFWAPIFELVEKELPLVYRERGGAALSRQIQEWAPRNEGAKNRCQMAQKWVPQMCTRNMDTRNRSNGKSTESKADERQLGPATGTLMEIQSLTFTSLSQLPPVLTLPAFTCSRFLPSATSILTPHNLLGFAWLSSKNSSHPSVMLTFTISEPLPEPEQCNSWKTSPR